MTSVSRQVAFGALSAVLAVGVTGPKALGQGGEADTSDPPRVVPTMQTVITGYGTVGWVGQPYSTGSNAFTAALNPIFLFQFQRRWLFEAELEFQVQEGITETGLEYAQLDVIAADNLTLVGGKFLLPFGVFGERLHPTWINKFPTAPPIYGHHVSAFGADPLLPILSDIGVMARGMLRLNGWHLDLIGFLAQGPEIEGSDSIPEFTFPAGSSDINSNKMVGGRLDISLPPYVEVNLSALNGDYDSLGVLDLTAYNIAASARYRGFELRGEYLQTRQEIEVPTGFPTVRRHGFYGQLSYRRGAWEPLLRWTQVFSDRLEGQQITDGARQLGLGLDYWFSPSIAIMVGYELNREGGPEVDNDRVVAHVAFGF